MSVKVPKTGKNYFSALDPLAALGSLDFPHFPPFSPMKCSTRFCAGITSLSLLIPTMSLALDLPDIAGDITPGSVIPGQYIVLLKEDQDNRLSQILKQHKLLDHDVFKKIGGFSGPLSTMQVAMLKNDPRVALVEPDYVVTAYAQTQPTGIRRIGTLTNTQANINGNDDAMNVDVAVIDTGIDLDHPDLHVVANVNTIDSSKSGDDDNGHGSHVAGTIGAKDNDIGAVGVAPGTRLWAVKVLDSLGSGAMSDIIEGIDYVTAHASEIEVANMSLGCTCTSTALNEAISRSVAAGVVYTVAAGNNAKDSKNFSPANHSEVITVSAIADFNGLSGGGAASTCRKDSDDTFADFSNFGSVVDIAAPGVCIYSTYKNGAYATISGTSMASPHVAGAAALYLLGKTKPTNATEATAVKTALLSSAILQGAAGGFSGDRDTSKEPLLFVGVPLSSSSSSSSSISSASSSSSSSRRFKYIFPGW